MPKELGKARRSDLTGHLPGEQAEYGSSFARFMEGAGQLSPLDDGTYLDHSSNGSDGNHTEVPGMQTEAPGRGSDTEIQPQPGGNGQHTELSASDTVFDEPMMQEALSPEPMLSPDPMGDEASLAPEAPDELQALEPGVEADSLEPAVEDSTEAKSEGLLEPVQWGPSADTLHAEDPEALDSIPDLTSPEHDESDDDDDEVLEETDKLPPRGGSLPTVKPEPHEISHRHVTIEPETSADTGILEPAQQPPVVERIDLDELSPDGEEETGISIEPEPDADEKITSKVEPRTDVDPRSADPGVRDTVNFYNQTQSLHEQKARSQGFPTIAPSAVSDAQPLDLAPEATAPLPRPEPEADTGFFDDDHLEDTSLLEPDTLKPEPPSLSADETVEAADRRDTDRFNEEDRHPARLPKPEGTDRVDKDTAKQTGELEPIADEKVASGKDTQRFYVAEILAGKPQEKTGDTTAELEPAEEGPPPLAASTGDTASGESTQGLTAGGATRREPPLEPTPLPQPQEVDTDFLQRREELPSERIIPEITSLSPEAEEEEKDGDDTVDEAAELQQPEPVAAGVERITTKVKKPEPEPRKESDKVVDWDAGSTEEVEEPEPAETIEATEEIAEPAHALKSDTEPDLTPASRPISMPRPVERETEVAAALPVSAAETSHSKRLQEEREETLRLIEQAESVVVKLREASAQSRADLLAISSRRAQVGGNGHDHSLPDRGESYEEPERRDEFATEIVQDQRVQDELPRDEEPHESDAAANEPAHRIKDRVPTRAIGEIIDEIDRKSVEKGPESLSALLDAVSRRHEPVPANGNGGHGDEDDDFDYLAAASSRLRETLERELEEDIRSGRLPVTERYDAVEEREFSRLTEKAPGDESRSGHHERHRWEDEPRDSSRSHLSEDLDRLWEVLDSRRTPTVVLPGGEESRMPPRDEDPMDGWTQEALWRMLIGIAVATFALGAVFVYLVFQIIS